MVLPNEMTTCLLQAKVYFSSEHPEKPSDSVHKMFTEDRDNASQEEKGKDI